MSLTEVEIKKCLALNPFDGDFGSPGDRTFRNAIVFARSTGICHDCAGPINPGDQQRRLVAIFDGKMRTYRWCIRCCRAMALSWTDGGKAIDTRFALRAGRGASHD